MLKGNDIFALIIFYYLPGQTAPLFYLRFCVLSGTTRNSFYHFIYATLVKSFDLTMDFLQIVIILMLELFMQYCVEEAVKEGFTEEEFTKLRTKTKPSRELQLHGWKLEPSEKFPITSSGTLLNCVFVIK